MHVVLFEPEIPPNTGNIARTCVATNTPLHLIEPLGFSLEDKHMRRAGLDYWDHLQLQVHATRQDFWDWVGDRTFSLVTKFPGVRYDKIELGEDPVLIFGKETTGLPAEWRERWPERCMTIPMWGEVRSLNLSNAVSIILYDAYRRMGQLPSL